MELWEVRKIPAAARIVQNGQNSQTKAIGRHLMEMSNTGHSTDAMNAVHERSHHS